MTTAREEAERQFPNNTVYHDGAYAGFIAGAEWQKKQPVEITDEMVERFRKAWHEADSRGELGSRVRAGLEAALGGSGE